MYFISHVAPVRLGGFPAPLVTGRPCQDFFFFFFFFVLFCVGDQLLFIQKYKLMMYA